MEDLKYMDEALALAREAAAEGEVPVGCVIVRNGQIVGRGRNRRETAKTALGHGEIEAIADACKRLNGWRLWDCTLYVTLEPCPMCAGAMVMSQLSGCVYGAYDERQGCCESLYALPSDPAFYHRLPCIGGLMEDECAEILKSFFSQKR